MEASKENAVHMEINNPQGDPPIETSPPLGPCKSTGTTCDNYCVPDELLTLPPTCTPASDDSNASTLAASTVNVSVPVMPTVAAANNLESDNLGALGGLNVYDSDPDDVPVEVPHNNAQNILPKNIVNLIPNKYRDVEQTDSDGSSSEDSDDSSSSSSESSSSSDEISPISDAESVTEVDRKVAGAKKPPRTDGELLLDDLPPIEDLHISVPEKECMEVGKVSAIVDSMVVVQALKNTPALDLDSVLFLDKGQRTLGRIFDVIGPVCEPAYCIRFNSRAHIQEKGVEKDMVVYCAPKTDHTSYVFLGELLKMKGSDASWKANNEPPSKYLDFSDDEEERRARHRKRQADSSHGAASTRREVVEPSSYERRMNAKNLARSQIPSGPSVVPPGACRQAPPQPPMARGVGRGWARPGVVIQNYHSAPAPPMEPFSYHAPPPPRRPGYTITRFGAQPAWPPTQNVMPMFPNAIPPIPPPYQFGMGTGAFFSMPPPPLNHAMPPSLFSSPPPPPPPNRFSHNPPF